ncbi:MAG: SCP2 sterol-binding domain-containing protein [Gammaproteobacteria bacterium]|nr:SCP2 sterol-binding domain-containing protein [Gammaproteobacteria bacterium]
MAFPYPSFLPPPERLRPARLIPFPLQRAALEKALAVVFRDQLASGALDFLERRWVAIVIEDAGIEWYITRGTGGLLVLDGGVKADVTFRGRLREFVLLASRTADPDTLFFQRRLSVTGSTELGLACKNVMDTVEWDRWPPLLRRVLHGAGEWLSRQAGPAGP